MAERHDNTAKTDEQTIAAFHARIATLKTVHPDCLMLLRMGEFYEAFGEDARVVADALGVALRKWRDLDMAAIPASLPRRIVQPLLDAGRPLALIECECKGFSAQHVTTVDELPKYKEHQGGDVRPLTDEEEREFLKAYAEGRVTFTPFVPKPFSDEQMRQIYAMRDASAMLTCEQEHTLLSAHAAERAVQGIAE